MTSNTPNPQQRILTKEQVMLELKAKGLNRQQRL